MTEGVKLRVAAAFGFALIVVAIGWVIAWLFGFATYPSLTSAEAIPPFFGAFIWLLVVNDLDVKDPKDYMVDIVHYRPFILSLSFFLIIIIFWMIARSVTDWMVEPRMYDYGPCTRGPFAHYPCGDQDLNSGSRYLASELVDKITAGVFLLAPVTLLIQKVRESFK